MPREIDWTDSEEIGILLQEKYPEIEPYSVRFTDLHKYVRGCRGLWVIRRSRMRGFWRRFRRPGMKSMRMRSRVRLVDADVGCETARSGVLHFAALRSG